MLTCPDSHWAAMAGECVAHLRSVSGHRRDDRHLTELVEELSLKSEDVRRLWADHEVKEGMFGVKQLWHCPGPKTAPAQVQRVAPAS